MCVLSVNESLNHRPQTCMLCKEHFQKNVSVKSERVKVFHGVFFNRCVASCPPPLLQIITVKDSKRRLSLSSEDSEAEEYQKEADDDLPVLNTHSQLLDDHHLKRVSK